MIRNYRYLLVLMMICGSAVLGEGPVLEYDLADAQILPGTTLAGTLRFTDAPYSSRPFYRIDISVEAIGQEDDGIEWYFLRPVYLDREEFRVGQQSLLQFKGFPGAIAKTQDNAQFLFTQPGLYSVAFHLTYRGNIYSSEAIEVVVVHPEGKNAAAWNNLPARSYIKIFYEFPNYKAIYERVGDDLDKTVWEVYSSYHEIEEDGKRLVEWLREHRDSEYGRQIVASRRGGAGSNVFPDCKHWKALDMKPPEWLVEANSLLEEISDDPLIMRGVLTEEFLQRLREKIGD